MKLQKNTPQAIRNHLQMRLRNNECHRHAQETLRGIIMSLSIVHVGIGK